MTIETKLKSKYNLRLKKKKVSSTVEDVIN